MSKSFKKVIKKYFDDIRDYNEDVVSHEISFKVMWQEVSYDDLYSISLILGTKEINFHGVNRSWGQCETCGGSEEYVEVHCAGVRFTDSDEEHGDCQIIHGDTVTSYE